MVDLWIQNNTDDRCRITIMDRVGVHGTSIKDPSDLGAGQTDSWRFGANSECTIRIAWYNDNNKNRPDHIEVGCNMVGENDQFIVCNMSTTENGCEDGHRDYRRIFH